MKKKYLKFAVAIVLSVVLATLFAGCVNLSEAEEEVVGKYELIELSVTGYSYITASSYEYFTIEFHSNKKCNIKSKAGVTEYDAEAEWKVNSDGEIEVITKQGFAKAVEKYRYEDGVISGTNSTMVNGVSVDMTIRMQRIVESTEE